MFFQFCKSQDAKKYAENYNKIVPEIQAIAKNKKQFYGADFLEFIKKLDNKGIKVQGFFGLGKTSYSEDIYIIHLRLYNQDYFEVAKEEGYKFPIIWVHFKEQLPDEIKTLTRKYQGELSPEVIEFLSNREIESIEFYGINGLKSKDRTVR